MKHFDTRDTQPPRGNRLFYVEDDSVDWGNNSISGHSFEYKPIEGKVVSFPFREYTKEQNEELFYYLAQYCMKKYWDMDETSHDVFVLVNTFILDVARFKEKLYEVVKQAQLETGHTSKEALTKYLMSGLSKEVYNKPYTKELYRRFFEGECLEPIVAVVYEEYARAAGVKFMQYFTEELERTRDEADV